MQSAQGRGPSTQNPRAPRVALVVPAGGSARRLGGLDKPAEEVAGRSLLQLLLDGVADTLVASVGSEMGSQTGGETGRDVGVAVVGPPRPGVEAAPGLALLWCREEPSGGGPAAAVAAGVSALRRVGALGDVVVVLPGDAPRAGAAVPALLAGLDDAPTALAAVAVDGAGHRQVLVAAHRSVALGERLADLGRADEGTAGLAGLPAGRLLPPGPLLVEVAVDDDVLADVDTPADLAALRARQAGTPGPA